VTKRTASCRGPILDMKSHPEADLNLPLCQATRFEISIPTVREGGCTPHVFLSMSVCLE